MPRQSAYVRIGQCAGCSFRVAAGGGKTPWAEKSAEAYINNQMNFHSFSCPGRSRLPKTRPWHWVIKDPT